MEQSIYELYMEQVNPQDTREIMQAEDTLTVRTVSSGGLYLPIVAEQTAQAVFDKAAELGITLSEYKVEEFSEGNSSKVENMILWKSADGVTGTYTDDTGSSPYIETDVTVERLAEIVK